MATTFNDDYNARQLGSAISSRWRTCKNNQGKSNGRQFARNKMSNGDKIDGNASDSNSKFQSNGRAYPIASKNGYHCTFGDYYGHTQDQCHMNSDNLDNRLLKMILDQLKARSGD